MRNLANTLGWVMLGSFLASPALANEHDGYIGSCLNAWGEHPFGARPHYKTLSASVKVFGIGQNIDDLTPTKKPALVLVDTGSE